MKTGGFSWSGLSLFILLLTLLPDSRARRADWTAQFQEDGFATGWMKQVGDPAGNTYVAGSVWAEYRWQVAVVKYDPTGKKLWSTRTAWPEPEGAGVVAAGLGARGDLYVLSRLWNESENTRLSKFDSEGTQLWERTRPAVQAAELAIDSNENVFVAGIQLSPGGMLMKYTRDGNEVWVRVMNAPDTGMYGGLTALGDDQGGGYLAGIGFVLGRFSSHGDLVWHRNYSGQHVNRLVADSAKNVYAIGMDADNQALVVKLNSAGSEQWQTRYSVPRLHLGHTDPFDAAMDANGSLYIGSRCSGDLYDVAKLDASGRVLWHTQTAGGPDISHALLAVDPRGNVALFCVQAVESTPQYGSVIIRYNRNGHGKELVRFGGPWFQVPAGLQFAPGGELIFTRFSHDESRYGSWITGSLNRR